MKNSPTMDYARIQHLAEVYATAESENGNFLAIKSAVIYGIFMGREECLMEAAGATLPKLNSLAQVNLKLEEELNHLRLQTIQADDTINHNLNLLRKIKPGKGPERKKKRPRKPL